MFAKANDINSLKLIDFGLSAQYTKKTSTFTGRCGTCIYMAPEVFSNYQYDKVRFFNYYSLWIFGALGLLCI